MSLPYSYKSEIECLGSEIYSLEEVEWELYHNLKNSDSIKELSVDDQKINLVFRSLFTINYPVEISFSKNPEIKIEYDIKLNKLIQVCIALVIFIAFFSSYKISGYLWFSAIFLFVFFSLNLFFVDNLIQKLIKSSSFFLKLNGESEGLLSEEQMNWIKDASKCPACGEDITEYDLKCHECGIHLRNSAKVSPFDASNYKHKRFKYSYKEKKKNKNDT